MFLFLPVMAIDHSIGVEHWDELEDILLPEHGRPGISLSQEEFDEAVHYETALGLTRMYASADKHHLLLQKLERPHLVRDCESQNKNPLV